MSEVNTSNSHVEEYLNYFCDLKFAPNFAVLLKGKWGSGKTWFINEYRKALKARKKKDLYISLYGVTDYSEIEYAFFQQLHPVLSSKGMAITGKILKGLLKGTLKIDLNDDKKDDGSIGLQIPEINLPEYFNNIDERILIFDDLERCKININNILGYINYFVEYQGLKVIIVANEDHLFADDKNNLTSNQLRDIDEYKSIKEKIIGKTFSISLDFEGALTSFIELVEQVDVKEYLLENIELIKDIYMQAKCENLRILKQIILDYERLFERLPSAIQRNLEFLEDFLKLLVVFSVEVKSGKILPSQICSLQEAYSSRLRKGLESKKLNNSSTLEKGDLTSLEEILDKYPQINLLNPFPNCKWWENFLWQGIIDIDVLESSMASSKYLENENTPEWLKLVNFLELSDKEFEEILSEVKSKFLDREYREIGVVKHVFGLFLTFSDAGIVTESRKEILEQAKAYIDHLRFHCPESFRPLAIDEVFGAYRGFVFWEKGSNEYQELGTYISDIYALVKKESMPRVAQELLKILSDDPWKFYQHVCWEGLQTVAGDSPITDCHRIPVLQYISPVDFIRETINMEFESMRLIFCGLKDRYKYKDSNTDLMGELHWLREVESLFKDEIQKRARKASGLKLKLLADEYLRKSIEKLAALQQEVQQG